MNVKVIKKEESKLFPRIDGLFEIDFAGKTPSKLEVRAELSKVLGVNEDLVVIKNIKSVYGENTCIVKARIYMDKKVINELEPEYTLKRNQIIKGIKKGKKDEKTPEKKEKTVVDEKAEKKEVKKEEKKPVVEEKAEKKGSEGEKKLDKKEGDKK